MITLHVSADERIAQWFGFPELLAATVDLFNSVGLPIELGRVERLAPGAVVYDGGDAQTIYDRWKRISQLRRDVILTPDTYLMYVPYYEASTITAGREYEFGNEYEELLINAYAPVSMYTQFFKDTFNPSWYIRLALMQLICHEIGHAFGASHDMAEPKTIMYGHMWKLRDDSEMQFSHKSLREMGVDVPFSHITEGVCMRPWHLPEAEAISNYFNSGNIADAAFPGDSDYDRTHGTVFDGDPAKQTYFRRPDYAHRAIDIMMPVGTPLFAPFDCQIRGVGTEGGKGGHVEMRSKQHERLYIGHAHMSKITVAVGEDIPAGYCVGLSGDTGACGVPHDHFTMGDRGLGTWNIDPITDPRFRHWFDGIPYRQKDNTHPDGFAAWSWRVCLRVNGGFMHRTERGGQKEYTFTCNEPITHLWHYAKTVQDENEVTGAVDLLVPKIDENGEPLWTVNIENEGKQVTIEANRGAIFGTYFYQAETEKGNSNPVRIKVVEPTIIM